MRRQNNSQAQLEPPPLRIIERVRMTTQDVHSGWVRATSILLRGLERLRLEETSRAEDAEWHEQIVLPSPP